MRIFFAILFLSFAASAQLSPRSITIGLIPGGSPENLKKQGMELAEALQKEMGLSVNIYISKDYNGLIDAMKNKKVDFAFFSAMTFVLAEKEAKAKVLLKKVYSEPFYFSSILVRKDSKIKKLKQLKGKEIVFVDKSSASGYLYPLAELKSLGISETDFKAVKFSGNHSQSVAILEKKESDAAAVFADDAKAKTGAWSKFSKSPKDFRVLWVSEPIPTDPFCVRQDFYDKYPKVTHSLMFSLIDIFEKYQGADKFSEVLGVKNLVPATSRQYDPVRTMVKNLKPENP